jgi:hypothetical protein
MVFYTGFNYVTEEKVVILVRLKLIKKKIISSMVPYFRVVLIVGGVVLIVADKNK